MHSENKSAGDSVAREFKVEQSQAGMRLDQWLSMVLPGEQSRSTFQKWIRSGNVTLLTAAENRDSPGRAKRDKSLSPSYQVEEGDLIRILPVKPAESQLTPVEMEFEVVFEDEHLAVIRKPAGIAVHAGPGDHSATLAQGILHRFSLSSAEWPDAEQVRPGIVHRLDKPTEGLLLIAKNPKIHRLLSGQFLRREVHKNYSAWLLSCPPTPSGEISSAIKRHPHDRLRMRIDPTGRSALTQYQIQKTKISRRDRKFALVDLRIMTGRTHQIRVHMNSISCPIVGDDLYSRNAPEFRKFGLLLFARKLGFVHPVSEKEMMFELNLPDRFSEFEATL